MHGKPVAPTKFTIRAEKAPNRNGVQAVLSHFTGEVMPFEELLRLASAGQFSTVFLTGGDPDGWITELQAEAFSDVESVIVQDFLPSPVLQHATHVLPSGTFVEREGTVVNHKGLAQLIRRSVRGPTELAPIPESSGNSPNAQGSPKPTSCAAKSLPPFLLLPL
ncbi:MAG UNVERIFIED_CONTAM: molybdopterin-dependent oxidoreductase [Planctomycetaceae bacterium]